jgi:hypothetical protein
MDNEEYEKDLKYTKRAKPYTKRKNLSLNSNRLRISLTASF